MYSSETHKKGQIMLVTLLVLMVIAVILVGLAIVLNRDVLQTTTNQKYEEIYNSAESEILRLVSLVGEDTNNIGSLDSLVESTILTGDNTNATGSSTGAICTSPTTTLRSETLNCSYLSRDYSDIPVDVELTISDTKQIEDFEIQKDENYVINLNDSTNIFTGDLDIQWRGEFALDFTFTYLDSGTGELKVITDVFDPTGPTKVYDSLASDNPFLTTNPNHTMNYFAHTPDAGFTYAVRLRLDSSNIDGFDSGDIPYHLTVTPRSKTETVTTIEVEPTNYNNYPFQLREFSLVGYDVTDLNSPVVTVVSRVSLFPQVDSVFSYGLLSADDLDFSGTFGGGGGTPTPTPGTPEPFVVGFGGGSNDGIVGDNTTRVATDSSGNSYISGRIASVGNVDFDPDPVDTDIKTIASTNSYFVSKFSSSGEYQWSHVYNPPSGMLFSIQSLNHDSSGGLIVGGEIRGTTGMDLDPSATGTDSYTSSGGSWDAFISKLNSDGNYLWTELISGGGTESLNAVNSDATGNIYVVGSLNATATFGSIVVNNVSNADGFTAKYDTNGTALWANVVGGTLTDRVENVDIDSSGNVYVVGEFCSESIDFDPGVGQDIINDPNPSPGACPGGICSAAGLNDCDAFVSRYGSNGNYDWTNYINPPYLVEAEVEDIVVSGTNIYVVGTISGVSGETANTTVDFDRNSSSFILPDADNGTGSFESYGFIAGYNNSGAMQWLNNTDPNDGTVSFISVDEGLSGDLTVTGTFGRSSSSSVNLDPNASNTAVQPSPSDSIPVSMILNYSTAGVFIDVETFSVNFGDASVSGGAVSAVGAFTSSRNIDPGDGTETITSNGGNDIVLLRYEL